MALSQATAQLGLAVGTATIATLQPALPEPLTAFQPLLGETQSAAAAPLACIPPAIQVVNYKNNTITRYLPNGTFESTLYTGSPLSQPNAGLVLPDGTLLVSNGSSDTIEKFNAYTGASLGTLVSSPAGGLSFPEQLRIGPDGYLYVASQANNLVQKFNATTGALIGTVLDSADGLSYPTGLIFDSAGNLYVSNQASGGQIRKYNASTGSYISTLYTYPAGERPSGLTMGADGNIYAVVQMSTSRIDKITLAGVRSTFVTLDTSSYPYAGIQWGGDGRLYIADYGENEVHVYDTAGTLLQTITSNVSGPHFAYPAACVAGESLGTIKVVKQTIGGDGTFTFTSSETSFNGLSLSTVGNVASSAVVTKTTGVYTITENAAVGTSLMAITVTGDTGGSFSAVDLTNRQAVLRLDYGENLVVTFTNAYPNLAIAKTDGGIGPVTAGSSIPYTIVVTNTGGATLNNIVLTDNLPSGLTYVPGSGQISYPTSLSGSGSASTSTTTPALPQSNSNTLALTMSPSVPAGATLTGLGFAASGTTLNGSYRNEIDLQIQTPSGGTVSWDFGNDLGLPGSSGSYNVAAVSTAVSGNANGTYILNFSEDFDDTGIDNQINTFILVVTYTLNGQQITTTASGTPPSLITSGNNITLNPGEILTVVLTATVNSPVVSSVFTNTAVVGSSGMTSTRTATETTPAIIPLFDLGNYVWFDTNNNGITDTGELGVAGVVVNLQTLTGTLTTTTNASGYYSFTNLPAGTYTPTVTASNFQSGGVLLNYLSSTSFTSTYTAATNGRDHGIDPASLATYATNGVSASPVALGSGLQPTSEDTGAATTPNGDAQNNLTADFGFYRQQIGNTIWVDSNNNGIIDGGEQPYTAGPITVTLVDNNTGAVLSSTTTSTGIYTFTQVPSGTYVVSITVPAGYASSTPTTNTVGVDNNDNGSASGAFIVSGAFTATPGANVGSIVATNANGTTVNPSIDFGLVGLFDLGNRVWIDTNNNGVFDGGEVGVSGVTVVLYNHSTGLPIFTTTTSANGYYTFTNLSAGSYNVFIPASNFQGGGTLLGRFSSSGASSTFTNTSASNNTIDHGIDTPQPSVDGVRTAKVTLGSNDPLGEDGAGNTVNGDSRNNLAVDLGFWLPSPAIDLTKYTNSADADAAGSGPVVTAGSVVTWTYLFTNTGNVTLTNLVLNDVPEGSITNCSPSLGGLQLAIGGSVSCIKTGTAIANGEYTNTAAVTGSATFTGAVLVGMNSVTDTNPSHYSVATVSYTHLTLPTKA